MLKKQWFQEQELRLAAAEAQNFLLTQQPQDDGCQHHLTPQGQATFASISRQLAQGELRPYPVHMGWQYYSKRGAAALLLGAALTTAVAPDTVQAACRKIVEAVEHVFVQYTEFQYTSHAAADTPFVPLVLQYMPDGLTEVEREQNDNSLFVLYEGEDSYFILEQRLLTEESGAMTIIDTENAELELLFYENEEIKLIFKDDRISFIWLHDVYEITGQTNLSREEPYRFYNRLHILRSSTCRCITYKLSASAFVQKHKNRKKKTFCEKVSEIGVIFRIYSESKYRERRI